MIGNVRPMGNAGALTLVITGGASGFGFAVAQRCAAEGMDVALLDIDGARVRDAAAQVAADHGVRAIGIAADLASAGDLDAAAVEVGERLGRCDLLWANVGVQQFGAVETLTDDEWRWVLDINVIGTVRTVRAFLPLLRRVGLAKAGDHGLGQRTCAGRTTRCVSGEQVRRRRSRRNPPSGAVPRVDRRLGRLSVGNDHPPPRVERCRPSRRAG